MTVDNMLFIFSFYIGPFQVFFEGKRHFPAPIPVPSKRPEPFHVAFYLLPINLRKPQKSRNKLSICSQDWAVEQLMLMRAQHMAGNNMQ